MSAKLSIRDTLLSRYDLNDAPFSLTPDPRYLYLSPQHQLAINKMQYVIEMKQGIGVIYGDYGHGKSTLIRRIYDLYHSDDEYVTIMLTNPDYRSEIQLLKKITDVLGLPRRLSKLDQMNELEAYLTERYAEGKNVLLLIDEAQAMIGAQFELIRQISNFESNSEKLIQVLLCGQNNLRRKLNMKRALLTRAAALATLDPFSLSDTQEMIEFRLTVAGRKGALFEADAVAEVFTHTKGVPRDIVNLCKDSLAMAMFENMDLITREVVEYAATTSNR